MYIKLIWNLSGSCSAQVGGSRKGLDNEKYLKYVSKLIIQCGECLVRFSKTDLSQEGISFQNLEIYREVFWAIYDMILFSKNKLWNFGSKFFF